MEPNIRAADAAHSGILYMPNPSFNPPVTLPGLPAPLFRRLATRDSTHIRLATARAVLSLLLAVALEARPDPDGAWVGSEGIEPPDRASSPPGMSPSTRGERARQASSARAILVFGFRVVGRKIENAAFLWGAFYKKMGLLQENAD